MHSTFDEFLVIIFDVHEALNIGDALGYAGVLLLEVARHVVLHEQPEISIVFARARACVHERACVRECARMRPKEGKWREMFLQV